MKASSRYEKSEAQGYSTAGARPVDEDEGFARTAKIRSEGGGVEQRRVTQFS